MTLNIYQVDAFSKKLFGGNPAAICPLKEWLTDELMQQIAAENNLSETAFYVKTGDTFEIRWFTPKVEVNLCGHATLATAHVIWFVEKYPENIIRFQSKSGELKVFKQATYLELDFPTQEPVLVDAPEGLIEAIGAKPSAVYKATDDYLLIFNNENTIAELKPNFSNLKNVQARGIICTAPSKKAKVDFVSRFFAPAVGVDEDPVTGSAHTRLIPYWSKCLNKTELVAHQISERKGILFCKLLNDRVRIGGNTKLYLKGKIYI